MSLLKVSLAFMALLALSYNQPTPPNQPPLGSTNFPNNGPPNGYPPRGLPPGGSTSYRN